ncbi:MAG: tandem-95 repeat protein, partial [Candidatus Marinimicrobia bacterium]|nr:tandem-95 repeat protein [Candidatus Neomarinimicrobiota bacterium]
GNDYLYFLTIFSNVSNQPISLEFYDAQTGDVVPVNYSFNFVANDVQGGPQSPVELDAGNFLVDLNTLGIVQVQKVGVGWVGSEEITFTVTDVGTPNLHSGSDAASFTVLPDNNPNVSQIPSQEVEVGSNFSNIDLNQYLTEIDGDVVYWTSAGSTNITVTITGNTATLVPTVGWIGMETISFIAHDDTPIGLTGSSSATFRVRGEDHIPGILDISDQTIGAGGSFTTFDLDNYLNEIDGDPVQWSYEFVNTSGSSIPPDWTINPANYEMSMNITSRVYIRGAEAGAGGYLLGIFSNGVLRGVASPVLVSENYYYFLQVYANVNSETMTFQFYDTVVGDVVPVFETITFQANTVIGNPTSPLELHAGNIIVNLDSQNVVAFDIINNNWSGTETVNFIVQDQGTIHEYSSFDQAVFTIDADHTPIISNIPDQTINEGNSFSSFDLDNYIVEQDNDVTVITYSGNSELTVSIGTGNLVTIGIPNTDWYGSETITFTITDQTAHAFFDTDVATFTVNNVNDQPTIQQVNNQAISEDSSLQISIAANDVDSPNLFYSAISDTNGVTLTITPTLLTITTSDFSGVASILVSVNDGSLAANTSFYLTVTPLDDPPITSNMDLSTNEDIVLSETLAGYDGDGDQLTYSIVSGSSHGSLNLTNNHTGTFTYGPSLNYNGTDNFTYKVETDARYALNFNGIGDYVTIPDSPSFDVTSFTVEAWVKPDGISLMNVIGKTGHPSESSGGFDLEIASDGTLYGSVYQSGTEYSTFSSETITAGEWNHVAMTWTSGGNLVLYINGGNESSVSTFTGTIANSAPIKIGVLSYDNSRWFDGQIDVVRIWRTVRSQIEILSGMYGRMDVDETGMISAWRMDEGTGTTISDLTSNSNNGSIIGSTWAIVDPAVTSNTSTVFLTIQPVNDSPSFTKGADQIVNEDSGETTVAGWATLISAGPLDELTQSLNYVVSNDNNSLFSVSPAISADGTLTYAPATDQYGSTQVSVILSDNGGTERNGSDHSSAQTFNITINPVNDEPTFVISADITVNEDDGSADKTIAASAKTITEFIGAINLGPENEVVDFSQAATFTVTTDNDGLFAELPIINPEGTLTYRPAHNVYGSALITVVLNDGGGTDNSGDDNLSGTFQITVNPVNDFPAFTIGANQSFLEDDGNTTISQPGAEHLISEWATNINLGPENEVVDFSQNATFTLFTNNDGLFSTLPAISPAGELTYTPELNQYGSATVTIVLSDNGGMEFGGIDTTQAVSFTVTVQPVNDQPTIILGEDIVNDEDNANTDLTISAPQKLLVGWATSLNLGPVNEVEDFFQHATITLTTDYDALFSELPTLFSNGTLRYTLALNMYGTANISMTLLDNGGTVDGGVDTFTDTFIITVNPVNDKPSFVVGANITENEDDGSVDLNVASAQKTVENWITGLVLGPDNEVSDLEQNPIYTLTTDNDGLFAILPTISPLGTLDYQPTHNLYGTATIQIVLNDNGGTDFGGDDEFSDLFTITVNPVNDEPYFTIGADITENEDDSSSNPLVGSSAKLHSTWATGIVLGPENEVSDLGQTATFDITTTNDALFAVLPQINEGGDLTYQIAQNKFGNAHISIVLIDNGGTDFGGDDRFTEQAFDISILPINDAPLLTEINGEPWDENTTITILEDQSAIFTVTAWEADTSEVIFGSSIRNITIIVTDTDEFNVAQVQIIPEDDWFGEFTVSVFATDEVYFDHNSFILEALPVNDAPSFSHSGNVMADEDDGTITIENWATDISMGPSNEVEILGQHPTFVLATDNDALFTELPAVNEIGTLSYSLVGNANGSASVNIFMHDNGGTDHNGIDSTSTSIFTVSVNPINDPVEFIDPVSDYTVNEDADPNTFDLNTVFTDIDLTNGAVENLQYLTFSIIENTNSDLVFAELNPETGVLSISYTANLHGSSQITVRGTDNVSRIDNSILDNIFSVTVAPVPDVPDIVLSDVTTDEDTTVDITFDASLTDLDGSETLSFQVGELPVGTTITDISETMGAYQFQLTPTYNSAVDFTFAFTAIATEVGGEFTTLTDSITVTINPIPDMPELSVEDQSGFEDTPIPLPISAALTDTDGSELLYIFFPDFPEGATFNHELIPVQGYGYLIQADFLADLAMTPPPNSDENIWLHVEAVSFESQTNFISREDSLYITVEAIADQPELSVSDVATDEDIPVDITFATALTDTDGSETLAIEITGLPDGAEMGDLADNGNGTFTFTVTPPLHDDFDFILNITSTATEGNGGDFRDISADVNVTVNAVADLPTLVIQNTEGVEDTDIPLDISASLVDTDGSETLTVYISGLTPGAMLSAGTLNQDESYTLLPGELSGLYITPAPNEHDFVLTIQAETVEQANQNSITDTQTLAVTIVPVNDDPYLGNLTDFVTNEDIDVSFTIQGTDVDIETDGQELQFSCSSSDEVLVL